MKVLYKIGARDTLGLEISYDGVLVTKALRTKFKCYSMCKNQWSEVRAIIICEWKEWYQQIIVKDFAGFVN